MSNPLRELPRYLRMFQKYLGKKIYLIFLISFFSASVEGFGFMMFLPILQGFSGVQNSAKSDELSSVSQFILDFAAVFNFENQVVGLLTIILAAFVIKGILIFSAYSFNAFLRGRLLFAIKSNLFINYESMSFNYYSGKNSGEYVNLINDQTTKAVGSFYNLTQFCSQFINTLIYISLSLLVAWTFGVIIVASGVLLLLVFKWISSYVRALSRETAYENGILSKQIIQSLQSFKYLVSTDQFRHIRPSVIHSISHISDLQVKAGVASGFTYAVREPVVISMILAIVIFHMSMFGSTLPPLLLSIVLFYRGMNAVLLMQSNWQSTLELIGSMELVDNEFIELKKNTSKDGERTLESFPDQITFDHVSFCYNSSDMTLSEINLTIEKNSSIALVGDSGAGKSTMVDLLTLIHTPSSGRLMLGVTDSKEISKPSWRRFIGYVSQDSVIFDDTILNNITLWSDMDESQEVAINVAKMSYLHDFIESLPEGYQTEVGERGVRLSGGQRQRLFIARELFKSPKILILDEATSALDVNSELAVQKSIDMLRGKLTLVIISHRLSTIKNVDRVYNFSKGKIAEEGSFAELIKDENSKFSLMAKKQSIRS